MSGRICRRLDGIPLAIELAAARLRMMPAAELEARLDQRFAILTTGSRAALPRQQTLRATVDWSWELLTRAEQEALAALSVFAGGFGLAAAEAVAAGPDLPARVVMGHLAALVDKSLVEFDGIDAGPGRYRLLETVRQYAASRLDALGPAAAEAARARHRDYYLGLAETAAPQLIGPDQAAWLDRLDAELTNLRAAIAFSLIQPDAEPGLRMVTSLSHFWRARGHAGEGADVVRALLDTATTKEPTLVRARALAVVSNLLQQTGSYATADGYCEEALAIARAADDNHLVGELLCVRAWIFLRQGQRDAALPLIESGLALTRPLAAPYVRACLFAARAHAAYAGGDEAAAAGDAAEALTLFRQAGDKQHVATMLGNLGNYEMSAGNTDAARRHQTESLEIMRSLNHRDGIAYQTFNLASPNISAALAAPRGHCSPNRLS
jgi:tetratricopeptide (TPR) repeat protein